MTKLFSGSSIFYYYFNTTCLFRGKKKRCEWYLPPYPYILPPYPFYQVNYGNISNSVFELWNQNEDKKSSQFRLLIPDNFLALFIRHDQFQEKSFF